MSESIAEEMKEENPISLSFEEMSQYPIVKRFGNMVTLGRDQKGYPRFLLGPHCNTLHNVDPLFFTAFVFCAFLIGLLFYSYYERFSIFWKIFLTLSCSAFLLSYLNVGFSRPGIAHSTHLASSF